MKTIEVYYCVFRKKYLVVFDNEVVRKTTNQYLANLSARELAKKNGCNAVYCFD